MDIDGCSRGPQQRVHHQVGSNDDDDDNSASEETGDSNDNVSDHNDDLTGLSGTLLREKISSEVKCNVLWYWFLHTTPNLTSSFHCGKSSKTPSANRKLIRRITSVWTIPAQVSTMLELPPLNSMAPLTNSMTKMKVEIFVSLMTCQMGRVWLMNQSMARRKRLVSYPFMDSD